MTDPDSEEFEIRIRALEIANAKLTVSVDHFATTVDSLTETVQKLRDTINQGRGALWLALLAAGGAGSIVTFLIRRFFGG